MLQLNQKNNLGKCNTARPWDARFLVPEKNRAAQNRTSWGLYLCTKGIFFSKNRVPSRFLFKIRVSQVFFRTNSKPFRCISSSHFSDTMGPGRFKIAIIESKISYRLIRNEDLSSRSRDREEFSLLSIKGQLISKGLFMCKHIPKLSSNCLTIYGRALFWNSTNLSTNDCKELYCNYVDAFLNICCNWENVIRLICRTKQMAA